MSQIYKPRRRRRTYDARGRNMMRLLTLAALLLSFSSTVMVQTKATTSQLAFMAGCWKFEAKGRLVEEHWMAPAGGSLMGISRTVVDGRIAEFEFMQIRDLGEGLTYIAKPSNQPEAKFVATSMAAGEVVFENPGHDFPQRIRYRRAGNALHARIEGRMNGKDDGFEFPYTRTECVP
jgi:hypothetical protein